MPKENSQFNNCFLVKKKILKKQHLFFCCCCFVLMATNTLARLQGFQWGRRYWTMTQFPALTASFHAFVLWMPEHVMLECLSHHDPNSSPARGGQGLPRSPFSWREGHFTLGTQRWASASLTVCECVCVCEWEWEECRTRGRPHSKTLLQSGMECIVALPVIFGGRWEVVWERNLGLTKPQHLLIDTENKRCTCSQIRIMNILHFFSLHCNLNGNGTKLKIYIFLIFK